MKTSDLIDELKAIDPEGIMDLHIIDANTGDLLEPEQYVKGSNLDGNGSVVWVSLR